MQMILDTLMYFGLLINIVINNFFQKLLFFDLLTLLKKNLDLVIFQFVIVYNIVVN